MKNIKGLGLFTLGLVTWGIERFLIKNAFEISPFIVGFGAGLIAIGFKE